MSTNAGDIDSIDGMRYHARNRCAGFRTVDLISAAVRSPSSRMIEQIRRLPASSPFFFSRDRIREKADV